MRPLRIWTGLAAGICVLTVASSLMASNSDDVGALRSDVAVVRQAQQKIEKDLQALKDLLMGKPPSLDNVHINVAASPSVGDEFARVAVVEFSDFQCPFCGAFNREMFGRIVEEYVKTGKVRYIARNFPLENSHPLAREAAEAALCAADQGKYWEARERFFANQTKLAAADMAEHAVAIGANPALLTACAESGKHANEIDKDLAEARDLGVRGAPSFFLGYPDSKDKTQVHAVKLLVGNVPFRDFQSALDELLRQVSSGQPAGK